MISDLAPKERVIFRMTAHGHSNGQIAAALFISVNTLKSHKKHILHKFVGARTMTHAVYLACLEDIEFFAIKEGA